MPRAPKLEHFTAQEHRLAGDYLAKALAPTTRSELVRAGDGPWLRNPTPDVKGRHATYSVALLGQADAQTQMVPVCLDAQGNPAFGQAGSTWLLLHDPHANRVWFVVWDELVAKLREAAAQPASFTGMVQTQALDQWVVVWLNLAWAVQANLVKLQVDLGKGKFIRHRAEQLAVKEDFVHLHCHSMYSLLDGANTIEGIARAAKLNGQPGIALTDHGVMYGTFKHWKACQEAGIRPIMGVEAYVVDEVGTKYRRNDGSVARFEYHQTILAMNQVGWENLCHLMTLAGRDHYYYVPRIDHRMLFAHQEGLIVLSGCFKGMVAHHLQTRPRAEGETELPVWLRRDPDRARRYMLEYQRVFGDRYFCEVHHNDFAPYMAIVPELLQLAADCGVPTVIAGDCHYEVAEDAPLQSVLTRISNQKVDDLGAAEKQTGIYYIRSMTEMQAPWATPEMFSRTCAIAQRCDVSFARQGYLFPPYKLEDDVDWAAFEASQQEEITHPAPARRTDAGTSQEAAEDIRRKDREEWDFVTSCVAQKPGATARELDDAFAAGQDGRIRKRLKECEREKLVHRGAVRPCTVGKKNAHTWYPVVGGGA